MDQTAIAALAAAGALALMIVVIGVVSRRRGRRLRTALNRSRDAAAIESSAAAEVRRQLMMTAAGEREAAWAARTAGARAASLADRVAELEDRVLGAGERTAALEHAVSELDRDLRAARSDAQDERSAAQAAIARATALETEVAAARGDAVRLANDLAVAHTAVVAALEPEPDPEDLRTRLHKALAEADRLRDRVGALEMTLAFSNAPDVAESALLPPDPWDPRSEIAARDQTIRRLDAELGSARDAAGDARFEVERLSAEITRLRDDTEARITTAVAAISAPQAPALSEAMPRLLAREAEIRDLEQRLATLSASRNAELKRLNERIASLERLYLDLDVRDARINDLEAELKQATEMLDGVRAHATGLEAGLTAAQEELAAVRRVEASAEGLASQLAEARRRVADLETESLRARSSDDEVSQLRSLLAAERDRTVRLEQRASTEGTSAAVTRAVAAATFPLQETIARLEAELASHTAPAPPLPVDDVRLIRGIGPKIATILAAHGVTSLRQIATFSEADIARIGPLLPVYRGRIVDDRWVDQARELIGEIA